MDRVDLRPEHVRFLTELLRDQRKTVGRIDGRFTGWDSDYGRERWTTDPSIDAIIGPYAAALNHYVRAELGYSSDLPYEVLTDRVHPWSYKEFEAQHLFVLDKLAEAMRRQPAHAGARRLRLLRRGHAVLRRRERHRAPGHPGRAAPATSSSPTTRPAT